MFVKLEDILIQFWGYIQTPGSSKEEWSLQWHLAADIQRHLVEINQMQTEDSSLLPPCMHSMSFFEMCIHIYLYVYIYVVRQVLFVRKEWPNKDHIISYIINRSIQCYSWGGVMGHRPIQQKNGPLTNKIAILNLERRANWNFKFISNKWKMAYTMVYPAITLSIWYWKKQHCKTSWWCNINDLTSKTGSEKIVQVQMEGGGGWKKYRGI